MRRFTLSLLAATAIGLVASQSAFAADLGRPVYKAPPPPPPPISDWSGIYVGIEGGYGWGHESFNGTIPGHDVGPCQTIFLGDGDANCADLVAGVAALGIPGVTANFGHQNGWLAGGFFGAQKQWGSWVLGIEGDIDGADIKGSAAGSAALQSGSVETEDLLNVTHTFTADHKIDLLGSVRGKVGWSFAPDWLIYGTGGMAFAHTTSNFTDTQTARMSGDAQDNISQASLTVSGSRGSSLFGWAAGAGIDWKLPVDAGSAWVFGVEYLHYQFLTNGATTSDVFVSNFDLNNKQSVDAIKGRISYLFSIH